MARKKKSRRTARPRRWSKWLLYVAIGFVAFSVALVLPLRWIDPVNSAFMLADDSGIEPVKYEWVAWDELGDAAPLAVVGSEDQRFADHFGLDLKAIQTAVEEQG